MDQLQRNVRKQYRSRRWKQVVQLSKQFFDIEKPFEAFVISSKLSINYPDVILKLGYPKIHLQNLSCTRVAIWKSVNKLEAAILYFNGVNPSSEAKYFCLQNFAVGRKVNTGKIYDFAKFRFVETLAFSWTIDSRSSHKNF